MLRWSLMFLVVALVAGAFGLTGVAGTAASIAQILFVAFLVLFCVTLISGIAAGRKVSSIARKERNRDRDLINR